MSQGAAQKLRILKNFENKCCEYVLCITVVQSLSMSDSFATTWTVAHQTPLSMGFPRQSRGFLWDLPNPEI